MDCTVNLINSTLISISKILINIKKVKHDTLSKNMFDVISTTMFLVKYVKNGCIKNLLNINSDDTFIIISKKLKEQILSVTEIILSNTGSEIVIDVVNKVDNAELSISSRQHESFNHRSIYIHNIYTNALSEELDILQHKSLTSSITSNDIDISSTKINTCMFALSCIEIEASSEYFDLCSLKRLLSTYRDIYGPLSNKDITTLSQMLNNIIYLFGMLNSVLNLTQIFVNVLRIKIIIDEKDIKNKNILLEKFKEL